MNVEQEFPLLVARNSKGGKKYWQIRILADEEGNGYTQAESWQETSSGKDSKHVVSEPALASPKNVGRSNETTSIEQAVLEAESKINKQKDKGYWVHGEDEPEVLPLPMLAHPYSKRKHNVTFPCMVQPKLDGVRMLHDGVRGWSRQGKEFLPGVIGHLAADLPEGVVLDGELMLPQGEYTFQQTISAVKREQDLSKHLEYHVYDIVDPDKGYVERRSILNQLPLPEKAFVVWEGSAVKEEDIYAHHANFVSQGYEGTMIRNLDAVYAVGQRSVGLQKYKDFKDSEFIVVDVVEGIGKFTGSAVFVCKTPDGQEFKATPRGTQEQRRQWFEDRADVIGQKVTVQYQDLSDGGVPRFPIVVGVRDYE